MWFDGGRSVRPTRATFSFVLAGALGSGCAPANAPSAPFGPNGTDPAIRQGDDGGQWVARRGVGKGTPYAASVLSGPGVVYIVAGWGDRHLYEGFATIPMSGKVEHALRQPKCTYPQTPQGKYAMYAFDIALNREGRSVFMNSNVGVPVKKEFGWTFVSPEAGRTACHLADVNAGNVTVLAAGPEDTIWGAGPASPYLWRFASDGSAKNFALPKGVSAFDSLTEGPDRDMWAQPANAQVVMRISPGSGRVLAKYKAPCLAPAHALTAASGFVWGYANNCVFSILPSGVANAYPVSGLVAEDSPHAIAAGPDGNPWFISRPTGSAGGIATVNRTTRKATFVALPSSAEYALALGTGPDGNVYVTDANDDLYVYVLHPLSVDPPELTIPQVRDVARITVTEQGTATWKASSANPSVVKVAKTSTPSIFNVTAIGSGKTRLTIEDSVGNSVVVPVTVL